MAELRRGLKSFFAAAIPEKLILIQTADRSLTLRVTPLAQVLTGVCLVLAVGWIALSAARIAVDFATADGDPVLMAAPSEALDARPSMPSGDRDARAVEALSAQNRIQAAMDHVGRQQARLLAAIEGRHEAEAALAAMRDRLGETVAQRDALAETNERLLAQMTAAAQSLDAGVSAADLADTLRTVTGALTDAVAARDAAAAQSQSLTSELAETELRYKVATRRHEEMIEEVRQAVSESIGPLEELIERADLDLDNVLALLAPDYSGQGGPLVPLVPLGVSTRSFEGDVAAARSFDTLMVSVDRMNLLRIAIGKVPYAIPVKDAYRFTSGFGHRRDPKGRGLRMHAGVDFAAPRGTPIYATADGVVKSAGGEGAYGMATRIQHDFGFETLYAHQSRLRVKPGQRVSRGDHIGDMGRTGRTTGVHLHYEVRLNGRPIDPMIYVEAAKDVF